MDKKIYIIYVFLIFNELLDERFDLYGLVHFLSLPERGGLLAKCRRPRNEVTRVKIHKSWLDPEKLTCITSRIPMLFMIFRLNETENVIQEFSNVNL